MDKVHRDRRKDVHTRLDFGEGPRERTREDSDHSSAKAQSTKPERLKVQDHLRYGDRYVLDRLDSRDRSQGRSRPYRLDTSNKDCPKDRERFRSVGESMMTFSPTPITMEEMMITTTAFIRGEAAASKKKGHTSWKAQAVQKSNFRQKPPPPMVTPVEKRSSKKFCDFHNDKGHSTNEWDTDYSTRAWINFMIVRSLSPYSGIIGRPGIREIQAVPSTAHRMLKFLVEGRIVRMRSIILIPTECTLVITSSSLSKEERTRSDIFKVALHPDFPDQEVEIKGTLLEKERIELCSILKKNLDIFAWKPSDMKGVSGSVAEHRLNIREGYSPVQQKKGGCTTTTVLADNQRSPESKWEVGSVNRFLSKSAENLRNQETLAVFPSASYHGRYRSTHQANHVSSRCGRTTAKIEYYARRTQYHVQAKNVSNMTDLSGFSYRNAGRKPTSRVSGRNSTRGMDTLHGRLITYGWVRSSNNEAEYEALIAGLWIAAQMGVQNVHVSVDSKLVANQVLGTYVSKEENMVKYLYQVKSLVRGFTNFLISQVPLSKNKKTDALSKIESTSFAHLSKHVLLEVLKDKSIKDKEVTTVVEENGPTWMTPIVEYLKEGTLPSDRKKARKLCIKARYRRSFLMPWSRCVGLLQAQYVIREIHERSCSMHADHGIMARLGERNKNWVKDLPHILWAHRIMIKSSLVDTPLSLTYGTEAIIPVEIGMPTYRTAAVDVVSNDEELWINLNLLEERRERAAICKAKAKLKMMKYYNARVRGVTFRPGDFIYHNNDASHAVAGGKLGPKWERPYEVTKAPGDGAYKLRSMDGTILPRTWNIANLKRCYL
nr:reverse transcriptase domain-containing protein [Tanacetum cinerariifolium]